MNKRNRQLIFNKYGGRCAYCGCELQKGWHVDHASPVRRIKKYVGGDYVNDTTGEPATEKDLEYGNWKRTERVLKPAGMINAHNDCFDNMMPSCASCNLYKHSADIETFRMILTNTVRGLNNNATQYKFAKRYELVVETNKPVVFYFETLTPTTHEQ